MHALPVIPRRLLLAVLVLVLLGLAGPGRTLVTGAAGRLLQHRAGERGMAASWKTLELRFPTGLRASGFALASLASGDTVVRAESLAIEIAPLSILGFHPAVSRVALAHAEADVPRGTRGVDPDTLAPGEDLSPGSGPAAPKVIRSAESLVRMLLLPARRMPRLSWRDVTVRAGAAAEGEPARTLRFSWLELTPQAGGIALAASGALETDRRTPFEVRMAYGADDRVTGGARLSIADDATGVPAPLVVSLEGRVEQDRGAREVRIAEPARLTVGRLPLRITGRAALEGPRFAFRLEADSLTDDRVRSSLPPSVLGPLLDVGTRGSWDYRLALDLDLQQPDSVRLHADVIPHGLRLDPATTRLRLSGLEAPFVAAIHLPRGRVVTRDLSFSNPDFRTLGEIDSLLQYAVLTNEDGGFWRHHGFSEEAVRGAIAHNLRVGAFRRGAGTITMQLARNLFLGHERTLARKGQEVVLAWVLEHLAGVSKRRLLEIYLNVIEWGPDVHGANEAARFYFGKDAARLTIDEALFLTIVIPSPSKWRWRLDDQAQLRPFARAQMHFIGRAMVARGWLRAEELPPAEQLDVRIEGPARDLILPPPTSAPVDTLSASLHRHSWWRFPWSRR